MQILDTDLIVWTLLVLPFIFLFSERYGSGLRKLPGPFIATLSDFWRFWLVYSDQLPQRSLRLHRKHGPLVRMGPRYVSCNSTEAIHTIYRAGAGLPKSDIYGMLQPQHEGRDLHNLFSTQDAAFHQTLKRNLANLYSPKGVESAEPKVDITINQFIDRLRGLSKARDGKIDLAPWLQWWAFDTIGEVNLSQKLEFVEKGEDVHHLCHASHEAMRYFGLMGQIQNWEKLYAKFNSLWQSSEPNPLFEVVMDCINRRRDKPHGQVEDKLDDFIVLNREKPEEFTERDIIASIYITFVTAHDVLAVELRAIMYHLAKNPEAMRKFQKDIDDAEKEGRLSSPVKYEETKEMTYVNAVINETLRIHPATGMMFERVVPSGGINLHGHHIPPGNTVGVNAWVFNRDPAVFGADSDSFRPERWIEGDESQIREMRRWLLTFGLGARSCIGKNLAVLEMNKLMVELYRQFRFELADPEKEWEFTGSWLTVQKDMEMLVTPRTSASR